MNEITIAGAGSGSALHLTPEVKNTINSSDVVVSNPRFLDLIPKDKKIILLDDFNGTFNKIQNETGKILILVSGDSGLYSLLPLVKKFFADKNIKVLPGLSSLQILCARAGEAWNDTKILSGHGRELNVGIFLNIIERNEKVIIFCDKKNSPDFICDKLKNFSNIEVFIGSNLAGKDEFFLQGRASEFVDKNFPALSIILIKNHDVYSFNKFYPMDCDFLREKDIVMTNENVRAAILAKLELNTNSLFWDIGAGSGSVSVAAANQNLFMEVHAIEKNPKACDLIKRNTAKFHLHNIQIHQGMAGKIIKSLPVPTHIFIGGSGGELKNIFTTVKKLKGHVRVVTACVTLENFHQAYELMKDAGNFEFTQISVTSSHVLNGELTLMKANNPVTIFSADF